jgi:hypothetical protein
MRKVVKMNYLTSTIKDCGIINIHPDSFYFYLHLATKDVTGHVLFCIIFVCKVHTIWRTWAFISLTHIRCLVITIVIKLSKGFHCFVISQEFHLTSQWNTITWTHKKETIFVSYCVLLRHKCDCYIRSLTSKSCVWKQINFISSHFFRH